jgi:hypothetical protein
MPRLRQVSRADTDDALTITMYDLLFGDRDPVAEPGTSDGTPGDWWTVFSLVPDVLEHAVQGILLYQSPKRLLDPLLRELAQARVGWVSGSQFVFSQHCKSLRAMEVSEEMIEAVPHWAAADCFDEPQRLVMAYTDCLALDLGRVPDGLFEALHRHLSDEQILELTYITAMYLQMAVMSRALHTEWDAAPEPVVEVWVEGADNAAERRPGLRPHR